MLTVLRFQTAAISQGLYCDAMPVRWQTWCGGDDRKTPHALGRQIFSSSAEARHTGTVSPGSVSRHQRRNFCTRWPAAGLAVLLRNSYASVDNVQRLSGVGGTKALAVRCYRRVLPNRPQTICDICQREGEAYLVHAKHPSIAGA